jgi:PDZ domain-containing protein
MKSIVIQESLPVFLATALAIGLASAAHPSLARGAQIKPDAPAAPAQSEDANPKIEKHITVTTGDAEEIEGDEPGTHQKKIIIRKMNGPGRGENAADKEVTWLGLSTEEPSDALASQLGLQSGEGVLVTYVATNSPAARAGMQKNDLLVEMDGQKLVLPAQLRKLVQMRKEGDKAGLTYYRGGKKQNTSATLGKKKAGLGLFGDFGNLDGLKQLHFQLKDLSSMNEDMKELRESLARAGVDQENIQAEVRRGVDQARKAVAEAMAQVHENRHGSHPTARALEELARSGVDVDKDATVTIQSRKDSVRTIVKTDETGTCVIVANPKKRLTAHDKAGKLVFDGEIETNKQQEKVPRDVWKKVQPMIEQLNRTKDDRPGAEDPAPKKTSARPVDKPVLHSSHMLADLRTVAAMVEYLLEPEFARPPARETNSVALGYSAASGVRKARV